MNKYVILILLMTAVFMAGKWKHDIRYNKYKETSNYELFSDTERQLIASVINSECDACTFDEKVLIASTILNRCENENFPDSIKDVIYQKGQYKGIKSNRFTPSTNALSVVYFLENGGRDTNYLYFYKNIDKTIKDGEIAVQGMQLNKKIYKHRFLKYWR